MAEEKVWSVEGFRFHTQQDVKLAEAEVAKIQKLEEKLDYQNPKMMKLVYDKTIDSRVFKTQVGFTFLKKLQDELLETYPKEEIQDIPVNQIYQLREQTNPAQKRVEHTVKKVKTQQDKEKDKLRTSMLVNAVLVILIALMFYITTTSKNPNILNYEKALQNKYVDWEQELTEREQQIREKEKELLLNQD